MVRHMGIAVAAVAALFALAAAPASAAPSAPSLDNSIMTAGQWFLYPGSGWSGTPVLMAHTTTCAAIPNAGSVANEADSGYTLLLYSESGCNNSSLIAMLPPDTYAGNTSGAVSYSSQAA